MGLQLSKSCCKGVNGDTTAFDILKSMERTTFWFGIAKCRHKGQRTTKCSWDHGSWVLAQADGCLEGWRHQDWAEQPPKLPHHLHCQPHAVPGGGRQQAAAELFLLSSSGRSKWFLPQLVTTFGLAIGYHNCTIASEAVGFVQGCCAGRGQGALGTSPLQAGLQARPQAEGKGVWKHGAKGTSLAPQWELFSVAKLRNDWQ